MWVYPRGTHIHISLRIGWSSDHNSKLHYGHYLLRQDSRILFAWVPSFITCKTGQNIKISITWKGCSPFWVECTHTYSLNSWRTTALKSMKFLVNHLSHTFANLCPLCGTLTRVHSPLCLLTTCTLHAHGIEWYLVWPVSRLVPASYTPSGNT